MMYRVIKTRQLQLFVSALVLGSGILLLTATRIMDRLWNAPVLTTSKGISGRSTLFFSQNLYSTFAPTSSFSSSSVDSFNIYHLGESQSFERKCQAHHHIGFIKIHKAGSSTVSNILFRFGVANNLTFVLPRDGVLVSFMQSSNWSNILPPPRGKRYDILCSHAVYVKAEVTKLLPTDTFYTAIIRHPFNHLTSSIYYFYGSNIPGPRKVKTYLKNPFYFSNLLFNKQRSFTNNSMSYELGLLPKHFLDKGKILSFLTTLDAEFGLILITELMDESLVLLRRYLCLEFEDILYVTRNRNKLKPPTENIPAILKQKHAQLDMADYMLYDFFSKKLRTRISAEGKDFMQEVRVFKSVLERLRQFCFGLNWPRVSEMHVTRTAWSRSFNISLDDCKLYLLGGNEILNYVKHYQYPDRF